MAVVARISPLNPATGLRIPLRVTAGDDHRLTGLDGARWWPGIVSAPKLSRQAADPDFANAATIAQASLRMRLDALRKEDANAPAYRWPGAPIEVWTGTPGADFSAWTLRFTGLVNDYGVEDDVLLLAAAVDSEPFEVSVLNESYAGTGGYEGSADLRDKNRPLALGICEAVEPVLIDAVNNVYQVHGYGTATVTMVYERGAPFAASTGNHASYAALVSASIPPGAWATCSAQGLFRMGAPAAGLITADVNSVGLSSADLIEALCSLSAVDSGRINAASLAAFDAACPETVDLYLTQTATLLDLIQGIARPCNAQAGLSWTGKLEITRFAGIGSPGFTLDRHGRERPPVLGVAEMKVDPPFWRYEMQGDRAWRPHGKDEIALIDELIDTGAYSATRVYRPGNVAQQAGSSWLYIATTPGSGNAPPSLPTTSNAYWRVFAQAGGDGTDGAPGVDGTTTYTWIAYADSADGTVNFTNGAPGDRAYIGIAPNKTTATESSTPGDYQWSLYKGPPGFGLVAQANVNVAGGKITKINTSAWDGSAYTSEGWTGGAQISARAGQTSGNFMVGLNTDPTTNTSWETIDYAWFFQPGGVVEIRESGSLTIGPVISYTVNDTFSIHYDNKSIRYLKNGVLQRRVPNVTSGLRFFGDTSIFNNGASLTITDFSAAGASAQSSDGNLIDFPVTMETYEVRVATVAYENAGVGNLIRDRYRLRLDTNDANCFVQDAFIPVVPGEKIYSRAVFYAASSPGGNGIFGLDFWRIDGTFISGASTNLSIHPGTSGASWIQRTGSLTVPSGAAYAKPYWYRTGGTGGFFFLSEPYLGRAEPGATIGAPAGSFVAGTLADNVAGGANSALNGLNGDGTVKNDKVDTLAINLNAVTTPLSSYQPSDLAVSANTWTDIATLAITATGDTLHFWGSFILNHVLTWTGPNGTSGASMTVSYRLVRDSTVIYGPVLASGANDPGGSYTTAGGGGALSSNKALNASFSDTPSAGSRTYRIQALFTQSDFGGISYGTNSRVASFRSLILLEAKR